MRAYYSTYKHIRLFVFGTPEGWHVGVYDIEQRKWTDLDGSIQCTLKEAKSDAQNKAASRFGVKTPEVKWHLRKRTRVGRATGRWTQPRCYTLAGIRGLWSHCRRRGKKSSLAFGEAFL